MRTRRGDNRRMTSGDREGEYRRGITLAQIKQAGLYTRPTSPGYRQAMLDMVERGRDDAGRVPERRGVSDTLSAGGASVKPRGKSTSRKGSPHT